MNFMTKVYKKQAEEQRFFMHVQDRVDVRMIQHVRELGWCIDKAYDGSALSVCAIIDECMNEEKMLKTHCLKRLMTVDSNMKVEEVHKDGDREDIDAKLQEAVDDVSGATLAYGRGSRRSGTSNTRRFGGGSLDKKLHAEGTRS